MVGLCNLSFHCVIHFLVRPFQKREYTPIVSYLLPFILSSWTHVICLSFPVEAKGGLYLLYHFIFFLFIRLSFPVAHMWHFYLVIILSFTFLSCYPFQQDPCSVWERGTARLWIDCDGWRHSPKPGIQRIIHIKCNIYII